MLISEQREATLQLTLNRPVIAAVNGPVCPAEELLYQAMKLAEDLSSKPRQALFDTKRLSRELIELDTVSAMNRMLEVITERLRSEEHRRESSEYVARRMRRT